MMNQKKILKNKLKKCKSELTKEADGCDKYAECIFDIECSKLDKLTKDVILAAIPMRNVL